MLLCNVTYAPTLPIYIYIRYLLASYIPSYNVILYFNIVISHTLVEKNLYIVCFIGLLCCDFDPQPLKITSYTIYILFRLKLEQRIDYMLWFHENLNI